MSQKPVSLGRRLRALREATGQNQVDVAAAVGITRSHLSKIETDKDAPGRAVLRELAAFFGVTMDYLETGTTPGGSEVPNQAIYSQDDLAWARLGRALAPEERTAVFDFIQRIVIPRGRGDGTPRRRRNT